MCKGTYAISNVLSRINLGLSCVTFIFYDTDKQMILLISNSISASLVSYKLTPKQMGKYWKSTYNVLKREAFETTKSLVQLTWLISWSDFQAVSRHDLSLCKTVLDTDLVASYFDHHCFKNGYILDQQDKGYITMLIYSIFCTSMIEVCNNP